uniref:Uncharacterized protein n=1 Tax=Cannabis sativa TaxID=3483 RepID=A0A803PGD8_CANSA
MAQSKISDFETAMKMNPTPSQYKPEVSDSDETAKTKKTKKKEFKPIICDVNPPKKKLVKKMMLEFIANKFTKTQKQNHQ